MEGRSILVVCGAKSSPVDRLTDVSDRLYDLGRIEIGDFVAFDVVASFEAPFAFAFQ